MIMSKHILVVAAHPDDELLGIGGTVRVHADNGDSVFALILGQGALARDNTGNEEVLKLQNAARAAAAVIGLRDIFFEVLPDNAFDTIPLLSIVKVVETYLAKIKPEIIYTHHEYDLNVDHRLAFQAVMTASRPVGADTPRFIYTFETLSSTEWQSKDQKMFQPNTYVDISETLDKKIEALSKYTTEMRPYPHARSLEGVRILAQYRGLEVGRKHAEALRLIRGLKSII